MNFFKITGIAGLFFCFGVTSLVWAASGNAPALSRAPEPVLSGPVWKKLTLQDFLKKQKDKNEFKDSFFVIDIRNEYDFRKGAVPDAYSIPRTKLRFVAERFFDKSDPIVVYGYSTADRAAVNSVIFLINKGYKNVMFLEEGWDAYRQAEAAFRGASIMKGVK